MRGPEFSYADKEEWPDYRLNRHYHDLKATENIPHSPERKEQIRRQIANVSFECIMRGGEEPQTMPLDVITLNEMLKYE